MLCHNPADSEDLAQEALLKAMRNLHRFDPNRGSLDTWLWSIVMNIARDAGRASTRAETLWERIVSGHPSELAGDEVETLALRRLSDAELLDEVTRLPRRYRSLIALRFGGDLSYDEIAQLLHDNPAALRQAMRRALKVLRTRLEETDESNA
jgi:RNA polymerase sigma-70 factor (ECF subfamily)